MSVYDLESVRLPVLTGLPLRLVAGLVESRLTRGLVLPGMLRDAGIPRLGDLGLAEAPSYLPVQAAASEATGAYAPPDLGAVAAEPAPAADGDAPGVAAYVHAYRSGAATPTRVAEAVLAGIEASERTTPPLRAFVEWDAEDLLAQAAESTQRLGDGRPRSLLEGVPIAVKDELDQTPFPTHGGTSFLGQEAATEDATSVARLRAAGALLIGKTNMHELGINPNGHNPHYGMVRNPHSAGHDPGGSSGGSGAAVAAGLCPIALGADGGGSVRVPAALCGVVGLKPTFGRMSEHGAVPLCWSVAHLGVLGQTVEDVALGYAVSAGPDPKDANSLYQPPVAADPSSATDLSGVRLGVFRPWFEHATPDIVQACDEMLQVLVSAGAKVVEVEIPGLDAIRVAHAVTILAEMAASVRSLGAPLSAYGCGTRLSLAAGRAFTGTDYVLAQRMRTRALATFRTLFEDVDVVVTPSTATTAPTIRENAVDLGWSDLGATTEIMRYIVPGNLAGLPALSFPAGHDSAGLPIGLHLLGDHWQEALLLRVAAAGEKGVDRRLPATFHDILGAARG